MTLSARKLRKRDLRECARLALERRGVRVEVKPGAGIVPGARLRTFLGPQERKVAVRTSLDREVGFTRHSDGRWITMPNVDEIVVVVPSAEEPNSAQVFCFDSHVMIEAFDAVLSARENKNPQFSYKYPIFIALDGSKKGRTPRQFLASRRRPSGKCQSRSPMYVEAQSIRPLEDS